MNILSVDTSTKNFSLAVSSWGKVIRSKNLMLKKVLSSSIIPAIDRILAQSNFELSDIDGFAAGLGPGSFTSLRVGLATVKGLAAALNKPVVGIPSLDAIAMNLKEKQEGDVCVLCDARRGLVYACVYSFDGVSLRRKTDYLLTEVDGLLHYLKGQVMFTGDGIPLWRDRIEGSASNAKKKNKLFPVFADEKKWFPQAREVFHLARSRFEQKKFDHINRLTPLYLYPEDCQVVRR